MGAEIGPEHAEPDQHRPLAIALTLDNGHFRAAVIPAGGGGSLVRPGEWPYTNVSSYQCVVVKGQTRRVTSVTFRCARWLPGGAASAIAASGTHALPLWAEAPVLTGYCAAGVAAATRLTLRRDVA